MNRCRSFNSIRLILKMTLGLCLLFFSACNETSNSGGGGKRGQCCQKPRSEESQKRRAEFDPVFGVPPNGCSQGTGDGVIGYYRGEHNNCLGQGGTYKPFAWPGGDLCRDSKFDEREDPGVRTAACGCDCGPGQCWTGFECVGGTSWSVTAKSPRLEVVDQPSHVRGPVVVDPSLTATNMGVSHWQSSHQRR